MSSRWSLCLPHPICNPHHHHTSQMPRPTHSSCFITRGPEIMNVLLTQFSPLFSNTISLCSSLTVGDQVSHPQKTTGKILTIISMNAILICQCRYQYFIFATFTKDLCYDFVLHSVMNTYLVVSAFTPTQPPY